MTDDPRLQQLLDQLLVSGATPEEVCASCPELLPVVRQRWRQMRRLGADLDAPFPPPDVPSTKPDALFTPAEPTPQPEGTAVPGRDAGVHDPRAAGGCGWSGRRERLVSSDRAGRFRTASGSAQGVVS
jgi:hypothetical protein